MKRTKRYSGFLIGDRVRVKETKLSLTSHPFGERLLEGIVIKLKYGKLLVEFKDSRSLINRFWISPNNVLNLTMIEEYKERLQDLESVLFPNIWDMFPAPSCIKAIKEMGKRAEKELEEKYGLKDNPTLNEPRENITHVSEETANKLNDAIQSLNNEPIVAQIGENGELYVEFEKELEERFKRMGMDNWKPEDHDIMPPEPFEDLTTGTLEEREEKLRKLAEQYLCETYGVESPLADNPALEQEPTTKEISKRPYPYNKDFSSTADY